MDARWRTAIMVGLTVTFAGLAASTITFLLLKRKSTS
ncbi:hypothetical protein D2E24_1834 [Bifidobacterium samirii]|uniref:Uncharacterized protein n=1 Tax=Bifidobacterium samirii TaxID=2306974 RepID=A0A430FGS8_9BIFI|nr:hypothetical protein D2E24_1834 [Bifidobacterium samirii]